MNRGALRFISAIRQPGSLKTLIAAISFILLGLAADSALAADGSWLGTTSGVWQLDSNWNAAPFPGANETATFNGAGNGNTTIDVGAGLTIGNIVYDTATAAAYTIGSGAVGSQQLDWGTAGDNATQSITVNAGVTTNQLINANLLLSSTSVTVNNTGVATTVPIRALVNNGTGTVTVAGNILTGTTATGTRRLEIAGSGNTIISGSITPAAGTPGIALHKTGTGTLTLSGGGAFTGNGVQSQPAGTSHTVVFRSGSVVISGGTYTVPAGEMDIGVDTASGGPGTNVNFTMNGGTLTTTNWFNIARGNGVGGVSSDVVLNNNATLTSANFGLGFNAAQATNLPRGSLTLNGTSIYTVTGNNANFNLAESPGSFGTITLNDTSKLVHNGAASGSRIGQGGTGILNIASANAIADFRNLLVGFAANGVGAIYNKGSIKSWTLDGLFMGDGNGSSSYFRNDNTAAAAPNDNANTIVAGITTNSRAVIDVISGTLSARRVGTGFFHGTTNFGQYNVLGGVLRSGDGAGTQTQLGFYVADTPGLAGTKWANVNVIGAGQFQNAGTVNLAVQTTAGTTSTGIVSLKGGGTMTADTITGGGVSPNTFLNFDSGTLQASAGTSANLITSGVNRVTIYAGGATIDTNSFNKTIAAPIAAPVADGAATFGVTGITLNAADTAVRVGRPIVVVSGGGGTGASAYADWDPVTGNVTGIVMTSPGSGYTAAPTVTVQGGIAGGAAALATTPTIGAVGGGGLTKVGLGTLTLSGSNTYTGATSVNVGTLLVNGDGTAATGAVTVAAAAALGGTGTIGGSVVMSANSTYTTAFAAGIIDPLAILGNLDLSAANNALTVTGTGIGASWPIIAYSGTRTGEFESIPAGYTVNYGTGINSVITLNSSASVAGDYNGDGSVNAADFTTFRDNRGALATDVNTANPNLFKPGTRDVGAPAIIDDSDWTFWKTRFNMPPGSGSLDNSSPVPEPAGALLCLIAAACGVWSRRPARAARRT